MKLDTRIIFALIGSFLIGIAVLVNVLPGELAKPQPILSVESYPTDTFTPTDPQSYVITDPVAPDTAEIPPQQEIPSGFVAQPAVYQTETQVEEPLQEPAQEPAQEPELEHMAPNFPNLSVEQSIIFFNNCNAKGEWTDEATNEAGEKVISRNPDWLMCMGHLGILKKLIQ